MPHQIWIQLHNLYKTSAAKWWTNSSFKILPELQLQNLDQPFAQSLIFFKKVDQTSASIAWLNFSFKILTKLLWSYSSPTGVTSTSFESAVGHISQISTTRVCYWNGLTMIGVRKIMIIIDIMNIMNIMILHERNEEEHSLLAKCLNSRIDRAISAPCHHAPPPSITKYKYRRKSMLCARICTSV